MAKSFFATYLTGDAQLDKKLERLQEKVRKKVTRSAMGKAGTVLKKAIAKRAPVGKTKALKKSIGASTKISKNFKSGVDFQGLRVGPNVGKTNKTDDDGNIKPRTKSAPHAHLVILGTKSRRITGKKRGIENTPNVGQPTGKIDGNDFVLKAASSAMPQAIRKLKDSLYKGIEKEANK